MRFYDRLTTAVLRRPVELNLAALIGVMDHGGRPPLRHGHVEGIEHQVGAQVRRHGPADYAATPRIEDDGQGFSTTQSGLGLRFVRERAEAIGGSCRVDSEPGSGRNVQVWIPRMSTVDEDVDEGGP